MKIITAIKQRPEMDKNKKSENTKKKPQTGDKDDTQCWVNGDFVHFLTTIRIYFTLRTFHSRRGAKY